MNLSYLAAQTRRINDLNGWQRVTSQHLDAAMEGEESAVLLISTKLALIHSEVSEALEALRKGDQENFAEELADTVIRILDLPVDLEQAIVAKLAVNERRGFRHGGKPV